MTLYNTGPTKLQMRRAAMVARGMSRSQVAIEEGVSVESVKTTMTELRGRVGIQPKTGQSMPLILELLRRKLLVWDRDRENLIVNPELFR